MANTAKIKYMIRCQMEIIEGLDRCLKVLREEADREMLYTHLSEHSPYYAKAISQLDTRRKLALAKIDILYRALTKE